MTATPETNRRRGATETNRRRGAPCGNRNALKSGRYTAAAKAERKRKRLLLRQLRAGLAYARSVIRARASGKNFQKSKNNSRRADPVSLPVPIGRKNFQKSKNNSRKAGAGPRPFAPKSFAYAGIPGDAMAKWSPICAMPMVWRNNFPLH